MKIEYTNITKLCYRFLLEEATELEKVRK